MVERFARAAALAALCAASSALGATAERGKDWDVLIAEAKKHGGVETKLDRSSSYVFQQKDGSFVSFTQLAAPQVKRAVCLIAKAQDATVCVDWDNGKVTLGERADAASAWKTRTVASLDELEAEKPGFFSDLMSTINRVAGLSAYGSYRFQNGHMIWVSRH
ncbi:MAG: hypothetical protein KGM15_12410 [Pseudomonadota bacterium]|nr:hypothetical protein [Pseudomonadota bacterium]